jgi:hypothetical protein
MAGEYYPERRKPYQPINLTELQIGVESGGKQFDPKTGQPLRSKKGATGVAQVMPATGPEAARDAGLPWDPERFKNDRDYNMRLGDAYQGKLDRRFGKGTIAATAAYNAGPTKVANLQKKYGADWAKYLPQETKDYIKNIKGVDVGNASGGDGDRIMGELGLKDYKVGEPGSNEAESLVSGQNVKNDPSVTIGQAIKYGEAASRYSTFLENAIEPLKANSAAVVEKAKGIAQTKESMANDFLQRANDLQAKIIPLQERRQAIIDRMAELDAMSPIERRLKSTFNQDYDPRVLRGRLERVEMQIAGHEKTYEELNKIRSGAVALQVDAEAADVDALNAESRSVLADANLMGQVAGAIRTNVDASILPMQMSVETLRLTEVQKQSLLGKMTLEMSEKLLHDAQQDRDGKVVIDGVDLTVGELKNANTALRRQDLSLRSMERAYETQDLQLANQLEDDIIEHMSPEQIQEALRNGGKYQGKQLSVMKLAQAGQAMSTIREQNVNEVVLNTATGQAGAMLKTFGGFVKDTGRRAVEMFGSVPQEMLSAGQSAAAQIAIWQKGFEQAKSRGVEREYIATTAGQLQSYQKQYDESVNAVAKKWGGGKTELEAVAGAWLRGNPISGDAAIKGLVTIARTGMPAGAKMSGPVLQAIQVAQAIVRDWDSPANVKSGTSLDEILKPGGAKKESDLIRRVQQGVSAVYADALTNELLNGLPAMARNVRDPNDPRKPHPFALVSQEDFQASIRHGDQEGYTAIGQKLGLNAQQTQKLFAEGTDGPTWAAVKKEKGLSDGQFADLFEELQAVQQTATLQALDASHSARPGFSPAKAYVDLLNSQEVINKVDGVVNAYGNSNFGSFLVSSSAGGGYRDSWSGYAQTMSAVYAQLHNTDLRQRISQQRSLLGRPDVRMKAVLRASGFQDAEAQQLIAAALPLAHVSQSSPTELLAARDFTGFERQSAQSFDKLSFVIQNHKFDNPQLERLRQRAAKSWDEMNSVVGAVADSVR